MTLKSGDVVHLIGEKETAKILWIAPSWKKPPRVILDRELNGLRVYSKDRLERVEDVY